MDNKPGVDKGGAILETNINRGILEVTEIQNQVILQVEILDQILGIINITEKVILVTGDLTRNLQGLKDHLAGIDRKQMIENIGTLGQPLTTLLPGAKIEAVTDKAGHQLGMLVVAHIDMMGQGGNLWKMVTVCVVGINILQRIAPYTHIIVAHRVTNVIFCILLDNIRVLPMTQAGMLKNITYLTIDIREVTRK